MKESSIIILFGVSGSGKTTVGQRLAQKIGLPFYDADDFHPTSNIEKMKLGIALQDKDRYPWLSLLAIKIKEWSEGQGAILACSALKTEYRELLKSEISFEPYWVFLQGSYELIAKRLQNRKNHFFDNRLLESQFKTLEPSQEGIIISIHQTVDHIVNQIKSQIV